MSSVPARSPVDLDQLRALVQHPLRTPPLTYAATGLGTVDEALGGGLPRRRLTELVGRRSSGKTSFLLAVLAAATRRGEAAALVDVAGTLDARSALASGVVLDRLLWVCPRALAGERTGAGRENDPIQRGLKATELLLGAGGFGLVVLDMGEAAPRAADAAWLRLVRGAERSAPPGTALVVAAAVRAVGGFAAVGLELAQGQVLIDRSRPSRAAVQGQGQGITGGNWATPLFLGLRSSLEVARSKLGMAVGAAPVTWWLR